MDPNAALNEIRQLLDGRRLDAQDQDRLIDLWSGLDNWMRGGGFLPSDWAKGR
jgi:hypothetical protein